jgi:ferrous iron transport protein B
LRLPRSRSLGSEMPSQHVPAVTATSDGGPEKPLVVALLGNPNTGKSTLFTALAGIPTRVGNYPGVTVEEKRGRFSHAGKPIELIDLPGIYSLVARSPDEQVAMAVLEGRQEGSPPIDCIVVLADATSLERNCYLVSQALSLKLPVVVALTLIDLAADRGITIDHAELAARLGCPVLPIVAPQGKGLDELADAVAKATHCPPPPAPAVKPEEIENAHGHSPAALEAMARYRWIEQLLDGVVSRSVQAGGSLEERIDAVLTHRVAGTVVFVAVMLTVFSSIFWAAAPIMDLFSGAIDAIAGILDERLPEGAIRSLLVDGVVAGVGGVVVFLPQIALLFLFVAVLEGCGYLARAAYLMDRLLVGVGLSGRSFIPLLSSFACAIPGIMATRTIENRRDRLITILVAPLMSCSARLPVYVLLTAAFVPNTAVAGIPWLRLPAVVLASMYALGVVVAAAVAAILSQTIFRGPPQPFVMELPGWRWPQPMVVLERVREACWSFLSNAGTLIVGVSIVVWALASYPYNNEAINAEVTREKVAITELIELLAAADDEASRERLAELTEERALLETEEGLEAARRGAASRQSFLGMAGRLIEPVVRPLGWDWRIGCAAIASFPAREVVLGTLGVIYNLGEVDPGEEEGSNMLIRRLRAATWDGSQRPVFTLPVALSIMVFFALCAQCASTLVVIGKETGSWIWPVVTFSYMTGLAWIGALLTYQLGTMLL